ncbi:Na+/H+ antiporter [Dictyobacter aurantiacus]|uniref:Na+/H+ antiporter n=1 Tax=Dictyobacter aurantiacus TaxID=1936993 RepID=A0A401ZRH8_9CHLR|nr:Na+/H+ antiporter [Dictyobacter aurantiacus]GCE09471.1 Na+/H+ antiporter [Dictyobacter aurantiacus]
MAETVTLIFFLFTAIVILAMIAMRLRIPYAIMLVLGGLIIAFIPGLPAIHINPDLILFVFLPPLIYSSAWQTSWREFHTNLRPILLLAIGLVLATTVLVAVASHFLIGLPWSVAFVLGAIISPTDAVAASATAQSLGLPRRIVTILEGESMVNDATGLVIYRFAVAGVVTASFSLWQAGLEFILVGVGSVLLGLAFAWLLARLHHLLDEPTIEISITLLTPFAAYLLAEELHGSGVLATLAAGLYLSRHSSRFFTSGTRLPAMAVWNTLAFQLNGFVFLLIGLALRDILENLSLQQLPSLLGSVLLVSGAAIVIRLLLVFASSYLPPVLNPRVNIGQIRSRWRSTALIGWTGLRGAVSLAAALALPLTLQNGSPFPQRNLLIFLSFGVILVTLVGQGLTLTPLIRLLGLKGDDSVNDERLQARKAATKAAIKRLDELRDAEWVSEDFFSTLYDYYGRKLEQFDMFKQGEQADALHDHLNMNARLRREVLDAERAAIIKLRDNNSIDDEVLRTIERDLDLEEQRLSRSPASTLT